MTVTTYCLNIWAFSFSTLWTRHRKVCVLRPRQSRPRSLTPCLPSLSSFFIQPRNPILHQLNAYFFLFFLYFSHTLLLPTRSYCLYNGRLLWSRIDRLLAWRSPFPGRLRSRGCSQGKLCRKCSFLDQERVPFCLLDTASCRRPVILSLNYSLKLIAIIPALSCLLVLSRSVFVVQTLLFWEWRKSLPWNSRMNAQWRRFACWTSTFAWRSPVREKKRWLVLTMWCSSASGKSVIW